MQLLIFYAYSFFCIRGKYEGQNEQNNYIKHSSTGFLKNNIIFPQKKNHKLLNFFWYSWDVGLKKKEEEFETQTQEMC